MDLFNLLETYVNSSKEKGFSTLKALGHIEKELKELDNNNFSKLLAYSGYIPDLYDDDSSEETLYSKFVELLTCIWAKKIGFEESFLPTQKSGTEDITIKDSNYLIVSDAKSFRLSRSQTAPNPKDTLKPGDFVNWKSRHTDRTVLGGLITFPAMHEWMRGSIVHTYLTDKNNKIMLLYYGHMSAVLELNIQKDKFIEYFNQFDTLYPEKINNTGKAKEKYYENIRNVIFADYLKEYDEYMDSLNKVNKEILQKSLEKIPSTEEHRIKLGKESSFEDVEKKIEYLFEELLSYRVEKTEKKIKEIKSKRKRYF